MKFVLIFCLSLMTLPAADQPAKKASVQNTIPAGAVQSADGSYRYTDAKGQKWIYRKTPFGVARIADTPTAYVTPPASSQAGKKTSAKTTIPAGAVQSADGSYRHTDAKGQKWIYRKTPFGVAKIEDKPAPADPTAKERWAEVRASEDGDTVRFERPGPFGTYKWQRKKTELDEMEKTVWEREMTRAAAKQE